MINERTASSFMIEKVRPNLRRRLLYGVTHIEESRTRWPGRRPENSTMCISLIYIDQALCYRNQKIKSYKYVWQVEKRVYQ